MKIQEMQENIEFRLFDVLESQGYDIEAPDEDAPDRVSELCVIVLEDYAQEDIDTVYY